ncbi:MAG: hypothetical protein J0H65_00050 [Rhizobiales bacterium]|nr:hypothetical protein [Hyphomicrobiales bacterium]
MTRTERSARKELRVLIERAVLREGGLPDGAARRIANRILRQTERVAEIGAALRPAQASPQPAAAPSADGPAAPVAETAPAFDPYEIGAVVTLHRHGADVLMERLAAITRIEDLRMLASAQNLAISPGWSTAEELRAAIVSCAEQRLAERHAAATVR